MLSFATATAMFNFSTLVHNPQPQTLFFSPFSSSSSSTPREFQSFQPLKPPTNRNLHKILSSSHQHDNYEEHIIGDCLVFEEGIFEDPVFPTSDNNLVDTKKPKPNSKKKKQTVMKSENLVPDKWKQVQAEINIKKKEVQAEINTTKKERPKIAQEIEFNSKEERRKIAQEFEFNSNFMKKRGLVPLRDIDSNEYKAYKEAKLAQLTPLVLDKVPSFCFAEKKKEKEVDWLSEERVEARNPRWAVYGKGLEDVKEFLNSDSYDPAAKKIGGLPFLFTWEERDLLKKKTPDLSVATSDKWLPLHTFAASGESFLLDTLLQHDVVDINAMDKDGLSALYKAIIGRKLAITHLLARNSANPFVQDNDGATLMHYAVQTASARAIKALLFYNVDINLQDNDGWTPLHLAVQTQRPDIVELLLIKGADRTLKNKDGLTPLDLCLYSGQNVRTYELIKLLKQLPYIDAPERRVNQVVETALNRHARQKWIRKNKTFEDLDQQVSEE